MNPAPLLVLALAVLVAHFSEGVTMSRCELRDQLMNGISRPNIRINQDSLATVICEVEKVTTVPTTAAPTTAHTIPRMTFPTMAHTTTPQMRFTPIMTFPTTPRMRFTPIMTFPTMDQDFIASNQPTLGPQDGLKLRGCIVIIHGSSRIDIKCIIKHFDWILKNASPECLSVSAADFFKGC